MIAVNRWARKMLSAGVPAFWARKATVITARHRPLSTDSRLPYMPFRLSLSPKNRSMPAKMTAMDTQSMREGRSRRNQKPSRMI
jgi:hypothetical protein